METTMSHDTPYFLEHVQLRPSSAIKYMFLISRTVSILQVEKHFHFRSDMKYFKIDMNMLRVQSNLSKKLRK